MANLKNRPNGGRDVRGFAPDRKQAPGGDAGPDANSITRFRLLSMSGTRLMEGMSSNRGKGGHK